MSTILALLTWGMCVLIISMAMPPVQAQHREWMDETIGTGTFTVARDDDDIWAGPHAYSWNAGSFTSGVYLSRLTTDIGSVTRKLTVMRLNELRQTLLLPGKAAMHFMLLRRNQKNRCHPVVI